MSSLFRGIFTIKLAGTPGWAKFLPTVDPARVIDPWYERRKFCILDRDRPWTLRFDYYSPEETLNIGPVISKQGFGIFTNVTLEHFVTARYRTEAEVKADYDNIRRHQDILRSYQDELRIQLLHRHRG